MKPYVVPKLCLIHTIDFIHLFAFLEERERGGVSYVLGGLWYSVDVRQHKQRLGELLCHLDYCGEHSFTVVAPCSAEVYDHSTIASRLYRVLQLNVVSRASDIAERAWSRSICGRFW